jgi:hypothetical protein
VHHATSLVRRESGSVTSLIEWASINSSGAGPTTTVVGLMCGSHTTQARSAPRLGSAAKSQPPLVRHPFGHFGDCRRPGTRNCVSGTRKRTRQRQDRGDRRRRRHPANRARMASIVPQCRVISDRLILFRFVKIMDRSGYQGTLSVDALIDTGVGIPRS